MIDSLSIFGFRGFDKLEIPRLGRVNLIVGKNAVGKSTVLEAVRLIARGPRAAEEIFDILIRRDEVVIVGDPLEGREDVDWLRAFHGKVSENPSFTITSNHSGITVRLKSGRRVEDPIPRWELLDSRSDDSEVEDVIVSNTDETFRVVPVRFLAESRGVLAPRSRAGVSGEVPCIVLHAHGFLGHETMRLWEKITLTDDEQIVIDALNLIDPSIERINFLRRSSIVQGAARGRSFVKRTNREPESLSSLGDGMVRLAEVSLALANAKGGFLLIDEIESGIHYTVQPELWKLIIEVAVRLDIQVFAVTHSWDCIAAFQRAASAHPADGVLIRINQDAEGSYATLFSEEELRLATKHSVEVR